MRRLGQVRMRVLVAGAGIGVVGGLGVLGWLAGLVGVVIGLVAVQLAVLVALAWVASGLRERVRSLDAELDRQAGRHAQQRDADRAAAAATEADLAELRMVPAELAALRTRLVDALWVLSRTAREGDDLPAAVAAMELALAITDGDEAVALQHRRLVGELGRRPDGGPAALAAVDRQLRTGDLVQAARLTDRLAGSGPSAPALRRRVVAMRDADGHTDEALALACDTARDLLIELAALRDPTATPRRLTREQRVMVAGFLYSGSGAVLDHLGDLDGVVTWPPQGELRILRSVGGYADLHRRLEAQGTLTQQDLVDHFLHVVGGKVTDTPLGRADQWRIMDRAAGWLEQAGPAAAGYLGVLLEGFVSLASVAVEGRLEADGFEAWVRAQLTRAFDAAATDNDAGWLVCDQAVTAWQLTLARYLPPSSIVVVHRDPRDQYVEVREVFSQPGRSSAVRTPEGFVARQRRVEAEVAAAMGPLEAGHGHRFLRLGFEDFVVDHDVQAVRLHAALGIDGGAAGDVRRFDPAVSRRNVGKHVGVLDVEVAAWLAEQLPDLLSADAEVPADGVAAEQQADGVADDTADPG